MRKYLEECMKNKKEVHYINGPGEAKKGYIVDFDEMGVVISSEAEEKLRYNSVRAIPWTAIESIY